jgi:ribose transport system substrate-binding protein
MSKRFFLASVVLVALLAFTGCTAPATQAPAAPAAAPTTAPAAPVAQATTAPAAPAAAPTTAPAAGATKAPATAATTAPAAPAGGKFLLGMVSISASDSSNARFINGATAEAKKLGWDVTVVDAHGSADEANSAFQNLIQRKVNAIIDLVFPVTSLGAGLNAAKAANVPVGTWGGGLGNGVVATNGSGGIQAQPIVEQMVKDLGGKGQVLALTYHTGEVCRDREQVFDSILKNYPNIKVTKNEVRIPGYLQDSAQFAAAWLAGKPAGSGPMAVWGCWDDPALGAISTLKQQTRQDVKAYGENGNADAINAVKDGSMTATAWAAVEIEGSTMVDTLDQAIKAGASWQPKAVEVPVVVVNTSTIDQFLKDHPDALKAPQ